MSLLASHQIHHVLVFGGGRKPRIPRSRSVGDHWMLASIVLSFPYLLWVAGLVASLIRIIKLFFIRCSVLISRVLGVQLDNSRFLRPIFCDRESGMTGMQGSFLTLFRGLWCDFSL